MHRAETQSPALAGPAALRALKDFTHKLWLRQSVLVLYALVMLLLMLPASAMLLIDDTSIRGVPAWAKPLKFMAATALFALTSAWFIGLVDAQRRTSPAIRFVVCSIALSSLFEVAYISHQAFHGSASHYNMDTALSSLMFSVMGAAAVWLCFSQLLLAHQIWRWPSSRNLFRNAVITGLIFTFALSVISGFMLGGKQPPPGADLPLLGWHANGGDLRPAHFLAVHAQQLVPFLGFALQSSRLAHAKAMFTLLAMGYLGLWFALLSFGLAAD